jgi:glycerol-3-phosphate acyltransferase PlsY
VERTSTGHHFPVYTDFKGGGTKVVTILRKISGDIEVCIN